MSHINTFINRCNHILLNESQESKVAFEYLFNTRGLNLESIEKHKIGYCPLKCNLPSEIYSFGESNDDIRERRNFSYFIKGKIIIPIYDEFGKLIGFSTRSPNSLKESTWWNVPFPKGNHLFLLSKSKKAAYDKNKIYLVEGYMDALLLYQNGINNVASLMGTNLSMRQIGLITRYCSNLCFCYDVDKNNAGQNAQNKSIAAINKLNHLDEVSVIRGLPEGVDPDQFIISNGADSFRKLEIPLTQEDIKRIIKQFENAA